MKTIVSFEIDHTLLPVDVASRLNVLVNAPALREPGMGGWTALQEAVRAGSASIRIETQKGWLAGWNKPGYTPDDEPQLFEEFKVATDYLLDELQRAFEERRAECGPSDDVKRNRLRTMYEQAMAAVAAHDMSRNIGDFFVPCGDYVWWVCREH